MGNRFLGVTVEPESEWAPMTDEPYLPPDVKGWLYAEFDQVARAAWEQALSGGDPNQLILYHYTDAEATRCILSSSTLWATHFLSLNDTSEFIHGRDIAKAELESFAAGSFRANVWRLLRNVLDGDDFQPYVFSLCRDTGNRLSQWRAYGGGGSGFAIGFDYVRLRECLGPVKVGSVVYAPAHKKSIVSQTISEYEALFDEGCSRGPQHMGAVEIHCRCNLVSALTAAFAHFKHEGFEEELEWRLVALRSSSGLPRHYRTSPLGVVPYVELKPSTGKLPIKRITQGPATDRLAAEHSLKALLHDKGYEGVEVDVSDIPLRP